jgi:uncharacterized protein
MANQKSSMTTDVFDAHFEYLPALLKLYNEDSYALTFFGGEPLMNWDLIDYVLSIVAWDPKCKQISLPTNGLLLTNDKYTYLKNHNVHVSLSYDGLWQREMPDVVNWVNGCKVMISPERTTTLKENYEHFVRLGILSPDFSLVRDDVWTIENSIKLDGELTELADAVIEMNKSGTPSFPGIFSLYMMDSVAGKRYGKRPFSCFAGHHGLGFMPDGKVYACARFGSDKTFPIFDSAKKKMIKAGNFGMFRDPRIHGLKHSPVCKKCNLYEFCNGGCTYSQLGLKADQDAAPLPNLCRIFKRCYHESFRIMNELKGTPKFQKMIKNMLENLNG